MADGHHDIHRLLFRNGLHGLDQCAPDLPDVRRLCRVGEYDVIQRAVFQCQLTHPRGVGLHLALVTVKGQKNIGACTGAGITHTGEVLAQSHDLPLHELHRGGVRIRTQDRQHAPDTGIQIGIRNQNADGSLRLWQQPQHTFCEDGKRPLGADQQVLEG